MSSFGTIVETLTIEEFAILHPKRWRRLRFAVFRGKGFDCVACNAVSVGVVVWKERKTGAQHADAAVNRNGKRVMLTLDHIIPRSKGGPTTYANLQPMCAPCNEKKADK